MCPSSFIVEVVTFGFVSLNLSLAFLKLTELEIARQRALVMVSVATRKQKEKEGASSLAPKGVSKGTSKRKNDEKDDRPFKKGLGVLAGLMIAIGLINQGPVRCHLTHKEHAVEMVESIIKEVDLDPRAKEMTEDLGVSGIGAHEGILGQVEMARSDAIVDFRASKPFIDIFFVYYGDEFKDCLKQVGSVYPNLDLSKVTMDDPLLTTPARNDTINEKVDNSTHVEKGLKDDVLVLAQPALERPVTPCDPVC
ncbi:hypothetical protein SO802_000800 [Lithocarpus litseifolius]|uniref:Uncharacterized protein n=1 Tax=Lithocarpus litseifolius TaxID=425828 RepID=A0AAW2DY98_9ROSI